MKKISTFIFTCFLGYFTWGQFNSFVTVPPLSGGGNTFGGICFNLTTNKPIIVDSLLSSFSTASGVATIWYNPQRINGQPAGINAANGWIQLGQSPTFNGISPAPAQPVPQVVPASVGVIMQPGDTFGFAIHWTGNVFSTTNTNIPTFTDGTVTIIVDAASAFTFNPGQTSFFNPRQLNGGVMYRLLAKAPNDAGVASIDSPQVFCPGIHPVKATIVNYGNNIINNVTVNWSVNGITQTPVSVTTPLDTIGGVGNSSLQVTLGNFNFLAGTSYTIKAWTSNPNNQTDTVNANDTATVVRTPAVSGTFTINSALPTGGTNFQNFNAFANVVNSNGICGPVVVNVAPNSGPYNEQVTFTEIPGTSPTNTITINGNGNTIQFSPVTGARHIIQLDGADYMTIDSLNIVTTSTTFGWGVHLFNNADHNTIRRCTIDISSVTSTTVSNSAGIVMSGSLTSAISAGFTGSHNVFEYNTILGNPAGGPGYGISLYGESTGNASNNTIRFNTIFDSYSDGIRVSNMPNTTIENNLITRPNKTGTTTFYGIQTLGTAGVNENLVIRNNRIWNVSGTIPATNTSTYAGIYVLSAGTASGNRALIANNIISLTGTNGIYNGIWFTQPNVDVIHNTVHIENTASTTGLTRGIFNGATAANSTDYWIRNNLVYINRTGTSSKHCIALSNSAGPNSIINNNAYFIVNPPANSGVGQLGSTNFATLSNWQTADNGAYDQNSVFGDPLFVNAALLNFEPTAIFLNGVGANLGTLAPIDINGSPRPSFPVPGAIQFAPPQGPDPGIQAFIQPSGSSCGTSIPVEIRVANFGIDSVTSMSIQWKVNNVVVDTVQWTGVLPPTGFTDIVLGSFAAAPNVLYTIEAKILTSGPGVDVDASNNTLDLQNVRTGLQGTYTINALAPPSATNFQSFNDFNDVLKSAGVCSAITVNVAPGSGPYTEQVTFEEVSGASPTNTITINGNGNIIQFNPTTNARHIIRLTGAKHFTIDSLTIATTATDFGWGVWLDNNADSNTIRNCTIDISAVTSITLSNSTGIVMTNSATSAITAGATGSYNLFEKNTIIGSASGGPGYGIILYGNTAGDARNNTIRDNIVLNSYGDAIRVSNMPNTTIEGNYIERPDRTNTTTFYGIYALGTAGVNENLIIRNNKIVNISGDLPTTNTSSMAGIYVTSAGPVTGQRALIANNIIEMSGTNGIYSGIWITQPRIDIVHNTIQVEESTSTTGQTRGIYSSALAANAFDVRIQNNIVSVDRTGSSTKHCINILNTPTNYLIDNNAYFITIGDVAQLGSTSFQTLNDWQASNNNAYDQNSVFANPSFVSPATFNFTPQSGAINNIGANLLSLVPTDFNGVARTATPDPGAIEFVPQPCSGAWAFSADSIYPLGVLLSWESLVDTFEIDWGPVGFTPGSAPGTTITGIATTSYNLALPAVGTCYHVYVREVCGSSFGPYTGPLLVCTPIEFDVEAVALISPEHLVCGSTNTEIKMVVRNNGIASLSNIPFEAHITGTINQTLTQTYAGPLAPGGTDTVLIGTLNTSEGADIVITAFADLATDQVKDNDTISKSIIHIPVLPKADSAIVCSGTDTVTLVAQTWPGVEYNWFESANDTVPLATGNTFFVPSVSTQNTYYLEYSSLTGSQTFTYSAGDIQSDLNFTSLPGASACPGVLTINLPVGYIVDSLDVEYDFTALAGGWMSDQRSQLRCITTGQSEAQLAVGTGSTGGTLNYKRTGLTIANGVVTGPLVFELHAGRTFGGNGCDASQNFIPNNTWKITLYYRGTPCSNVRVPVTVGIAPQPTAAFTYTISNYTVSFTGTFTDADSVYWTFGTAGSSSQQNPTFTFPQNGVYPVCVTAFNSCGTATKCDTLTFSIGIDEIALQNRLKVYPNPNAGIFEVTFSDDVAELPIEVLDLTGKAVYRATWKSAAGHYYERLDLHTLPAGTYMLRIHSTAGQLTRKVVVQK